MTLVKICGLTTLADAHWAWQCGADLLGFIFVRNSPRYLTPSRAAHITGALLDEGCALPFVGVFADEEPEIIREVAEQASLHLIQLHGQETPEHARELGRPVIIARRVRDRLPWAELARYQAWAYLLDSYTPGALGGTGRTWRWELLQEDPRPERIILAGGLTPENVVAALRSVSPWGVDVSSGVESQPGIKDPLKVERFIRGVREEPKA